MNPNFLPPADTSAVFALLSLITDPVAAKARLDELVEARNEYQATIEHSTRERAALTEHREGLAAAKAEHDKQIDSDRQAHERELAGKHAALAQREATVERAEAQVAASKAENEKLAADLTRRFALLKAAGA